jgi:hypothetical protein
LLRLGHGAAEGGELPASSVADWVALDDAPDAGSPVPVPCVPELSLGLGDELSLVDGDGELDGLELGEVDGEFDGDVDGDPVVVGDFDGEPEIVLLVVGDGDAQKKGTSVPGGELGAWLDWKLAAPEPAVLGWLLDPPTGPVTPPFGETFELELFGEIAPGTSIAT